MSYRTENLENYDPLAEGTIDVDRAGADALPTTPEGWYLAHEDNLFLTEAMHETVTVIGDRETNGDFAGPEATQVEIDRVVSEKVRDWMNQAKTIEGQSMHMNRRQDKAAMSNLGFRLRAFTTLSILGQRDYPDVASADAARATVEGVFSDLYTYAPDYKTKTQKKQFPS